MSGKLRLSLPFDGEWFVFSGGDTAKQNLHRSANPWLISQQYAFDLIKPSDADKTHLRKGATNTEYETFGQAIIAPADGIVVEAADGIRDNTAWQDTDIFNVFGNHIIIKHGSGAFSVICHLKRTSIKVKVGAKVKRGQLLGKAGNSGNSTEPHLHYHLQDRPEFAHWISDGTFETTAKGVKAFFSNIRVKDKTGTRVERHYSPVKGDIVSNA